MKSAPEDLDDQAQPADGNRSPSSLRGICQGGSLRRLHLAYLGDLCKVENMGIDLADRLALHRGILAGLHSARGISLHQCLPALSQPVPAPRPRPFLKNTAQRVFSRVYSKPQTLKFAKPLISPQILKPKQTAEVHPCVLVRLGGAFSMDAHRWDSELRRRPRRRRLLAQLAEI